MKPSFLKKVILYTDSAKSAVTQPAMLYTKASYTFCNCIRATIPETAIQNNYVIQCYRHSRMLGP